MAEENNILEVLKLNDITCEVISVLFGGEVVLSERESVDEIPDHLR